MTFCMKLSHQQFRDSHCTWKIQWVQIFLRREGIKIQKSVFTGLICCMYVQNSGQTVNHVHHGLFPRNTVSPSASIKYRNAG